MQQNGDLTKRIFIATLISFVFFMAYDYFFVPKDSQVTQTTQNQNQIEVKKVQTTPKTKEYPIIATITTKNEQYKIDEIGRISKVYLEGKIFENKNHKQLQILSDNLPKPLEIRFSDEKLNKLVFNTKVAVSDENLKVMDKPKTLTITQKLDDLIVNKILTFYPDGHYTLEVKLSKNVEYYISPGYRPNAAKDMYTFHGVIIKTSDDKIKMIDDGDGEEAVFKNAKIAAAVDRYYTTFFYTKDGFDVYESKDKENNPIIFIKGKQDLKVDAYIGPKYVDVLANIDKSLTDVVEYGIITFIAKPLFVVLDFLYGFVHNWGVAIILLTILVRFLLFPLTFRGMVSMYKLKDLAPKMKEIQHKYKGDPQKMQLHMMQLYKKHKVNPLGGCLPLLLQIPVFYGIYRLLLNSMELKGASFLWINDLSAMDPFFILPVLMGITMYIHQKITPTNFQDPMQEKIFKFLPVIFTVFMVTFPAGLTLYWTVNNILSIIQQYIINKMMEKGKK